MEVLSQKQVLAEVVLRGTTTRSVACAAWAPDGRLGVATNVGVCVLDRLRQQWVRGDVAKRIAWSPDKQGWDARCLLAVCWGFGGLSVYEPPRVPSHYEWRSALVLRANGSADDWRERDDKATDVAWHGAVVGSAHADGSVRVWEEPTRELRGPGAVAATAIARSRSCWVWGDGDGSVTAWRGEEPVLLRPADGRAVHLLACVGEEVVVAAALSVEVVEAWSGARRVLETSARGRPVVAVLGHQAYLVTCASDGELCCWRGASLVSRRPSDAHGLAKAPVFGFVAAVLDRVPADAVKRTDACCALKVVALFDDPDTLPKPSKALQSRRDEWLWVAAFISKRALESQVTGLRAPACKWLAAGSDDDLELAHLLNAATGADLTELRARFSARWKKNEGPPAAVECPACGAEAPRPADYYGTTPTCPKGHAILVCARTLEPIPLDRPRWVCPACDLSVAAGPDLSLAVCPLCRVSCALAASSY